MSHAHDSTRFRGLLYVAKSQQGCWLIRPVSSHHMLMHDANLRTICLVSTPFLSQSHPLILPKHPIFSNRNLFPHVDQIRVAASPGCLGIKIIQNGGANTARLGPYLGKSKKSSCETHVNDQKQHHGHRQALQTRQILKFSPNSWACFRNMSLQGVCNQK